MFRLRLTFTIILLVTLTSCGKSGGQPTSTPRIVVHPHVTHFAGTLSGGFHVSGTIYPSIPAYNPSLGRNDVVASISRAGRRVTLGSVRFTLRMIGMAMRPQQSTLRDNGREFVGKLLIPMYGPYRVAVVFRQHSRRYRGSLPLNLPVPLG